jgi:hypothetical protein
MSLFGLRFLLWLLPLNWWLLIIVRYFLEIWLGNFKIAVEEFINTNGWEVFLNTLPVFI